MKLLKQKIGTARSGRGIYIFTTGDWELIRKQTEGFSDADHFDAWVVFERLTVRELRRRSDTTSDYTRYLRYVDLHRERLSFEFIESERLRLGLATSPDLVRFAAKLTENIFLD